LPEEIGAKIYKSCCGKIICCGCVFADETQNRRAICPFCRAQEPDNISDAETIQRLEKRLKFNDPWAFYTLGVMYFFGEGVVQDKPKAFGCYFRGAELGSAEASYALAKSYYHGDGIAQDKKKAVYYGELAAMQGNSVSRYNLGVNEAKAGKYNKALKHWLISCERGQVVSLKAIKRLLVVGRATKEDCEKALRAYKEYVKEVKSDQRDEAAAFDGTYRYYSPLEE
jgi:TPR repeat protein